MPCLELDENGAAKVCHGMECAPENGQLAS